MYGAPRDDGGAGVSRCVTIYLFVFLSIVLVRLFDGHHIEKFNAGPEMGPDSVLEEEQSKNCSEIFYLFHL